MGFRCVRRSGLALFVVMLACGRSEGAPMGFQCKEAPALLGHAGAKVQDCREVLPDFHRVVLVGGDLAHGEVFTVVWDGGLSAERGLAALGRYLSRVKAFGERRLDVGAVSMLLRHFDAVPRGFDPERLGGSVGPPEVRSTLVRDPFTVTLFEPGWSPPVSPPLAPMPAPPLAPGSPPGGLAPGPGGPPSGPPAGPPSGPPSGPPTGPFGGPPTGAPGGVPGQTLGRAILKSTADYRLSWEVSWRRAPSLPFEAASAAFRP